MNADAIMAEWKTTQSAAEDVLNQLETLANNKKGWNVRDWVQHALSTKLFLFERASTLSMMHKAHY